MSGAGSSGERRRDQGQDGGVLRAPLGSAIQRDHRLSKDGMGFLDRPELPGPDPTPRSRAGHTRGCRAMTEQGLITGWVLLLGAPAVWLSLSLGEQVYGCVIS